MDVNKYQEGQLLLIDKPLTWTSFDVVKKLRYTLKVKKIGHAGTLDPLATGLLLIGTGKFTKKLNELQGMDKVYDGVISIGKTTPSYDLETEFENEQDASHITDKQLQAAAQKLTGPLAQVPPAHSAVKVNGVRAYKKARKNQDVKLEPRNITIHEFEILKREGNDVHFRIGCTKGTYIRSMARDFGELLGVGAHLSKLRRTSIGPYQLEDAHSLEDFIAKVQADAAD
ncbi:tRNA pseudouridine(55) synthase TruB [Marinoscillum furvescens]|uniref:tRNA pseudouridine synthase B n=1 Tax=Marinoscillum furvescens DSM 4134 TaxID=1122208 RepID=A0A3D9L7F4_MARFU|nr:tRNA pseudouridine(55) synthase TruB [Marinoscillum furvescens]REE01278.1 tRNA pseudouridine synthase B [Marinoscillum furvescens DSM 4134]